MRLLAAGLALLLLGCAEESYSFEPGHFDPDRVPGIERLEEAAARGDADAQFQIAFFRLNKTGDFAAALPVFERLADEDHLGAIGMLAHAYMYGKGVEVDLDTAALWLERAAALGDERAARDLTNYRAHQQAGGG